MPQTRNPAPAPEPTGRFMSQSAASRTLGMSRGAVLARVATGELEAEMVDGTPVIVRASVEAYLQRQAAAAVPA